MHHKCDSYVATHVISKYRGMENNYLPLLAILERWWIWLNIRFEFQSIYFTCWIITKIIKIKVPPPLRISLQVLLMAYSYCKHSDFGTRNLPSILHQYSRARRNLCHLTNYQSGGSVCLKCRRVRRRSSATGWLNKQKNRKNISESNTYIAVEQTLAS